MSRDVLPLCTTRELRGRKLIRGAWCVPIHCMNCGVDSGYCPEPTPGSGYVGYLCDKCAEDWSDLVGTMLVPEEVHARLARDVQLDEYGRVLTPMEQAQQLDDPTSTLSKLLSDRLTNRPG